MARVKVIRNTPNLDKTAEGIKDLDAIIKVATLKLQTDLLSAYSRASNLSDNSVNKRLTDNYSDKKQESGRNPIRDLNYTGNLKQSFGVRKDGEASYSTGPRGSKEQKQMEGNIGYDDNLMKVGDKARKKVVDFVNERIKKGGK